MAEKTSLCKHPDSCLKNSLRGFIRGAIIGLGIRAAIGIVLGLIKRTIIKNPASLLKIFSKENMKLVYFLTGMVGVHRSVLCISRTFTNCEKKSSFLAGLASGVPLLFEESESRVLFSLYMLVRAGDAFCKYLVSAGFVPRVPKFMEIVYIAALSVLIYVRVFHPEATNKGFSNIMGRIIREPNDMVYIDMSGFYDKIIKRK